MPVASRFRHGMSNLGGDRHQGVFIIQILGGNKMVRKRRIWSPEHFHHVGNRGNWQENLFRERRDYFVFLKILNRVHQFSKMEICSYCLMSNHYHLLIRTRSIPLSSVMRRINKSYTDYFNEKYEVRGHLFEKRFFSNPVYDDYGLLEVSRYIHMNPVDAKISSTPQNYYWSSYKYFFSPYIKQPNFFTSNPIVSSFPGESIHAKKGTYCQWLERAYRLDSLYKKNDLEQ